MESAFTIALGLATGVALLVSLGQAVRRAASESLHRAPKNRPGVIVEIREGQRVVFKGDVTVSGNADKAVQALTDRAKAEVRQAHGTRARA